MSIIAQQKKIQICKSILTPTSDYNSEIENDTSKCVVYEIGKHRQLEKVIEKLVEKYVSFGIPLHKIAVLHFMRPTKETGTEGIKFIAKMLDETNVTYVLDKHPLYDRGKRLIQWLEKLAIWCLSGWTTFDRKDAHRKCNFEEIQHYWEVINVGQYIHGEYDLDLRTTLTTALWEIRGQNLLLHDWLNYLQENLKLDKVLISYNKEFPDEVNEFETLVTISGIGEELESFRIDEFAHMLSAVQLTTLHSSKGMEFDAVIIAGIERLWGNNDEHKRLLYVGATRAKQQLSFIYHKVYPEYNPDIPPYINKLDRTCGSFDFFAHHKL